MNRRTVLSSGAAILALLTAPRLALALYAPRPAGWRTFELVTRIELPRDGQAAQAWVPVPSMDEELWSKPGETTWEANTDEVALATDPDSGARMVHAVWAADSEPAVLTVTSTVATQNRSVDLLTPRGKPSLSNEARATFTAATELLPTDGIVAETAAAITEGAKDDFEKARRIYEWVVEQTERDPEVRGCGLGDIASMLQTGDLTGKCADLNALYVGLARASGIPARDLYGIRVAPSAFGYKSLGTGSEVITKSQHCRAEVFLEGFGWVPTDPADVRKVVLEEPPNTLTLASREVEDVRAALFGSSEGNWIAFNDAHDVALPGKEEEVLPFLMYPAAEVGGEMRDELDPDAFTYSITVREVTA
ncbi:transglutaminase-like domain-containing protein [Maritimibacter sp. DP1N21-5]|uniref:transglutaminase-like domain-containing protein n=1 Tax=Maritimibacter sp. DP1N21-5 TaxID=2836867 RepID=UPI001C454862|nr:transglutaminase-like domain-containing protein [Maritimibacter sp. DP1N21-5]MBV7408434.1 transglutaminase-like domain-containing protein [Maritimibacter sp. DP1N21-5]